MRISAESETWSAKKKEDLYGALRYNESLLLPLKDCYKKAVYIHMQQ